MQTGDVVYDWDHPTIRLIPRLSVHQFMVDQGIFDKLDQAFAQCPPECRNFETVFLKTDGTILFVMGFVRVDDNTWNHYERYPLGTLTQGVN